MSSQILFESAGKTNGTEVTTQPREVKRRGQVMNSSSQKLLVSLKLALFLVTPNRRRALHLRWDSVFGRALTLHPAWPARHLFVVLF